MVNRRDFVVRGAAAAAGIALSRALPFASYQSPVAIDRGFARVIPMAEGVWATIADGSKGAQAGSNGGFIAGRTGTLLIEGHMQPAGAALEIEAARGLAKSPIQAAVNTHYHFDHTFGNSAYAQARIPIIAHPDTPRLMRERYIGMKGKTSAMTEPIAKQLASATTDVQREHLKADLTTIQGLAAAIEAADVVLPSDTTTSRRIDLGGLSAVIETRLGHSPTDIIIRVPERNMIFTGDLVQNGMYPVTFDADVIAWRSVLDGFLKEPSSVAFIPGHGAICGLAAVREFADIFDDLRGHSEKMLKAGVPLAEAQHRYVVPEKFQKRFIFGWGLSISPAIAQHYARK